MALHNESKAACERTLALQTAQQSQLLHSLQAISAMPSCGICGAALPSVCTADSAGSADSAGDRGQAADAQDCAAWTLVLRMQCQGAFLTAPVLVAAGPQTVSAGLPLPLSLSLVTARLESSYYRQPAAVQSDLAWMQV